MKALIDQASPSHNSVLHFKYVTWCHIAHLTEEWFSQKENWNFMTYQALRLAVTLYCLLEQLVKRFFSLLFEWTK